MRAREQSTALARLRVWLTKAAVIVASSACTVSAPQAQTEAQVAAEDPPARVGRLGFVSGPVTLTDLQGNTPEPAVVNWPITSQDRLTTGQLGRAEVRVGSTAIRIDGDSVVDFPRIDDETIQIVVQRGSVAVRVRNREKLNEIDVVTPRESIVLEDVGRYRVDVDRNTGITSVTSFVGHARIESGAMTFVVRSGQRGEVSGQPQTAFQIVAAIPDTFDDWVASRDRRDDTAYSARYVSPETTGIESLDEYGDWRTVDSHGAVWFPRAVAVGWQPYRYGRWAYIAPWGWTWIDDSPWGFAPFHYGRWVFVGGAWGWVPGVYVARPAYAPALVAWYGNPGVSVNISVGGLVGWFPLGPGEVFIPGFHCSRGYINRVNHAHIVNIHHVTVIHPPAHYRYRDPGHSTWVRGDGFRRHDPIHRIVQPPPRDWTHRPPVPRPAVDPLAGRRTTMPVPIPRNIVTEPQRVRPRDPATAEQGARVDFQDRGRRGIGPVNEHGARPLPARPDSAAVAPVPPAGAPGVEQRRVAPIVRPAPPRDQPETQLPPRRNHGDAPRERVIVPHPTRTQPAVPAPATAPPVVRHAPPPAVAAPPAVRPPPPANVRSNDSERAPAKPAKPDGEGRRDGGHRHGKVNEHAH